MDKASSTNDSTENLIELSTHGFSVRLGRSILLSSSLFFEAALHSGMLESLSGHFSLPEFTPRQLQHLQNFLLGKDIFTSPVENEAPQNCNWCSLKEKLDRLLESTLVADYLQMSKFKRMLTVSFHTLLRQIPTLSLCLNHVNHNCGIFTNLFPILFDHRLRCLKKVMLRFMFRLPVTLLSSKFINISPSQTSCVEPISHWLSSDKIAFTSEDELLEIVIDWLNVPDGPKRRRMTSSSNKMLLLLPFCVRIGLLTSNAMFSFVELLKQYSDYKELSVLRLKIEHLLAHELQSTFQSSLCLAGDLTCCEQDDKIFRPRADHPVFAIFARQISPLASASSLAIHFIDLLQGRVLKVEIPTNVERILLFEQSEGNPIHICTTEAVNCQHIVFLLIHQINTASLKGLVWDLATLKAEWLPTLHLQHNSLDWAAASSVHLSSPRAVGVVHCQGHLMAYYSFSMIGKCVLCVYRYDPRTCTWSEVILKILELPGVTDAIFTPMPRATVKRQLQNHNKGDIWLYGSIDSANDSLFLRLQPMFKESTMVVEFLPSPDFVLRAYNLVAFDFQQPTEEGEVSPPTGVHETLIFPFNACQRDNNALHMCFSQSTKSWRPWDPMNSCPSTSDSSLKLGLSRNHIGFHGVVCTSSHSFIHQNKDPSRDDLDSDASSSKSDDSTFFSGNYLVMAGRLAQSVNPPSPRVSGVWLLNPGKSLAASPTFTLPSSLDTLLHRATASGVTATVALSNWSALEEVVDHGAKVMRFPLDQLHSLVLSASVNCPLAGRKKLTQSNSGFHHSLPGGGSDSD